MIYNHCIIIVEYKMLSILFIVQRCRALYCNRLALNLISDDFVYVHTTTCTNIFKKEVKSHF